MQIRVIKKHFSDEVPDDNAAVASSSLGSLQDGSIEGNSVAPIDVEDATSSDDGDKIPALLAALLAAILMKKDVTTTSPIGVPMPVTGLQPYNLGGVKKPKGKKKKPVSVEEDVRNRFRGQSPLKQVAAKKSHNRQASFDPKRKIVPEPNPLDKKNYERGLKLAYAHLAKGGPGSGPQGGRHADERHAGPAIPISGRVGPVNESNIAQHLSVNHNSHGFNDDHDGGKAAMRVHENMHNGGYPNSAYPEETNGHTHVAGAKPPQMTASWGPSPGSQGSIEGSIPEGGFSSALNTPFKSAETKHSSPDHYQGQMRDKGLFGSHKPKAAGLHSQACPCSQCR